MHISRSFRTPSRLLSVILCLSIVLSLPAAAPALADSTKGGMVLDPSALGTYVDVWNASLISGGQDFTLSYDMDGGRVSSFTAAWNPKHTAREMGTDLIPPTACAFVTYSADSDLFSFCFFDSVLSGNLENVVFYTDSEVITPVSVTSDNKLQSYWAVSFTSTQAEQFTRETVFTAKTTIDGKTAYTEVDYRPGHFLYDLFTYLRGGIDYSRAEGDSFQSASLLPPGAEVAVTTPEQGSPSSVSSEKPYSFREDYEGIDRCVQSVFYVEIFDFSDNLVGSASGFVAFDDHSFVTNYHVVDDAAYLVVYDEKHQSYTLDQLIGTDKVNDIAILVFPEGEKYEPLPIQENANSLRGQPVVTIGSPKGLQNTVSFGNISAFPTIDGVPYIQITAPISHGSSGGVLMDDSGHVIGITSAGVDEGENLGFAVPIDLAVALHLSRNAEGKSMRDGATAPTPANIDAILGASGADGSGLEGITLPEGIPATPVDGGVLDGIPSLEGITIDGLPSLEGITVDGLPITEGVTESGVPSSDGISLDGISLDGITLGGILSSDGSTDPQSSPQDEPSGSGLPSLDGISLDSLSPVEIPSGDTPSSSGIVTNENQILSYPETPDISDQDLAGMLDAIEAFIISGGN